jgi:Fic-DOC domain mobile mystery protein B
MNFVFPIGATLIDRNEAAGLIPAHITLQSQLNEYEEANIVSAQEWLAVRRRADPLNSKFLHTVHRKMFDKTWKWAGKARRTDKNIGGPWFEVPTKLHQLLGDVRAQVEYRAYPALEIAARYHHRLVAIHVFSNGNGRHARIMADLLLQRLTGERFGWGEGTLAPLRELRSSYIQALREADAGDYQPLLRFVQCGARAAQDAPVSSTTPSTLTY